VVKRFFDIAFSVVGLVLFLPFFLATCLLLRFTGEGEVFYLQDRIGRGNKPFKVIKFVTMVKNSPTMGAGDITLKDDPRVLPIGRILRGSKLNEVPQLLNVLAGTMSVVGPRPQTPKNLGLFSPGDRELITSLRPGLTGIGSVVFRDEERIVAASRKALAECYREDIAPYKAALERWYYHHQNLLTDVLIIVITVWVVLFPRSTLYRTVWRDLPAGPAWLAT
jgi:lipopolysaccharide/colanic/teichoic acid biosynthesis glycosyltransferase